MSEWRVCDALMGAGQDATKTCLLGAFECVTNRAFERLSELSFGNGLNEIK
jgi:hypothetical protein